MPASQASDDADASMLDDATSTSSADILAADLSDSNQPATPIREYHAASQYPSEPTPPHTGGPDGGAIRAPTTAAAGPSLNANGKRALPSSATDLRSAAATLDAVGNVASGMPPARPGYTWQADEEGILVEVFDESGGARAGQQQQQPAGDEPGAKWMSKKAQDEMRKAMEQVVDREYMIKKKYGDVVLNQAGQPARS